MKKIFSLTLALVFLGLVLLVPASAAEGAFVFQETTRYEMAKPIDVMPNTFEATLRLPASATARGGVIVGNYGSGKCINFEMHNNGNPRLYITDSNGTVYDWKFTSIDAATGEWVHVTIVRDTQEQELRCYIDGELGQTLALTLTGDVLPSLPLALGTDQRGDNTQYFKGDIRNVALYSDVRTADEIKADMTSMDESDLIAYYDLSDAAQDAETFSDLSGNGYDAKLKKLAVSSNWLDEGPTVQDYDYSFAVVGDTQVLAQHFPDKLAGLYDWIVANAEAKQMKYVLGLGDITETNVDAEWKIAKENITKLDSVVPYSLNRGNHDGSAQMNKYFSIEDYSDEVVSYNGKMENTYRELKVGAISYLIMTLDFGASDKVLEWASEAVEAHPDHNVIITTHAYLFRDGTTLDQNDVCPPATNGGSNNGDHLWEKFISQHENIVLVLSGHDPCDNVVVTQTKGVHGNTVTQMLIDPQGTDSNYWGTGLVAMFYFSDGGRRVQVEYYSTARQQWFKSSNQKTVTLDVVESEEYKGEVQKVVDAINAIGPLDSITDNEQEKLELVQAAKEALDTLTELYGESSLQDVTNYRTFVEILEYITPIGPVPNPMVTLGDINDDGSIDASDALLALQHSVKLITLSESEFLVANVDASDTVDASDALLILQASVKLIQPEDFPAVQK